MKVSNAWIRHSHIKIGPFNFNLTPSDLMLVVGENGSGKTSLLNVLSGLNHFDEGMVDSEGIHLLVPDESTLFDQIRVDQVLASLSDFTADSQRYHEMFKEEKHLYGLELTSSRKNLLKFYFYALQDKQVFLLDEPDLYLDEKDFEAMLFLLLQQQKNQITILSSNRPWLYERYATHYLIFKENEVIFQGSVNEFQSQYSYVFGEDVEKYKDSILFQTTRDFGKEAIVKGNHHPASLKEFMKVLGDQDA